MTELSIDWTTDTRQVHVTLTDTADTEPVPDGLGGTFTPVAITVILGRLDDGPWVEQGAQVFGPDSEYRYARPRKSGRWADLPQWVIDCIGDVRARWSETALGRP